MLLLKMISLVAEDGEGIGLDREARCGILKIVRSVIR
jgi:hypothetical protein